jgi:PAS domain S-box-containing protein
MNKKQTSLFHKENRHLLRVLSGFLIGFFLIMTFLTAFFVVPKINQAIETQHVADSKVTLQIKSELFRHFIDDYQTLLRDLAKFPVITSAALLSQSDNPDFIDLVDNFLIDGQKSRLVLKNIAGEVIYQTSDDLIGDLISNPSWLQKVLDGDAPYHFQLLRQEANNLRFALSVPVIYRGHIEGVLSAEITSGLDEIFSSQTINDSGGFKLRQKNITIQTDIDDIKIPRVISKDIIAPNIELTYIGDDAPVLAAQKKLRNNILGTLFIGLVISFILFTIFGYQLLADKQETTKYKKQNNAYILPIITALIGAAASISAFLIIKSVSGISLWMSFSVLLSGLVLTFFITYTFIQFIRQQQIINSIVDERTQEVKELTSAMENAVEGVSQIDPQGCYTFINEAYAGFCGYKPEELLHQNWEKTVHEDDRQMMNDAYDVMLKTGKVVAEPRGVRKDGSIFFKRTTMISKYDEAGKFVGHHCFMNDISERKKAEEEILRSNSELERFAFICSHDLQEPLRMIRSFSEKLQDHLGDQFEKDAKGKKYFNFVIDGATRAQDLIRDILAYSSIDSNAERFETVRTESIISTIKDSMVLHIEEHNCKITHDTLPDLSGNKTQIYQLFQNLINNGLKYQEDNPEPHVHIGVKDEKTHWEFSIKDNGIGMEERHLGKIFDVFQRLHKKSRYAGTGVGLSICKKVVERHGGKIWVNSKKGKGSTFYFTLLKPKNLEDKK